MKIRDIVRTKCGGRLHGEGPFTGTVVGFSTWKNYPAVNVKKSNGKIVQCLLKNLSVLSNINTPPSIVPLNLPDVKRHVKPSKHMKPFNLRDYAIWYQSVKDTYIYIMTSMGFTLV